MGLEEEEEGPEGLWVRVGQTSSSRCGELRQEDQGLFVKMRSFNSALCRPLARGRWTWFRLWSSSVRGCWGRGREAERGRGGMSSASLFVVCPHLLMGDGCVS